MSDPAQAIALQLKWSMVAVRRLLDDLEGQGVHVVFVPTTGDLCPRCAAHYATEDSGFCIKCTTDLSLERQREADAEEEARLREEAERAVNEVKKQRERMREIYDANPRKKSLKKWIEWCVENPDRWKSVMAEVEAQLREEEELALPDR